MPSFLSMSQRVGRNEPCPCGSGKKFKRCCLNATRDPSAESERLVSAPVGRGELTLLVETPRGVIARTVPSASPLRTDLKRGYAAEAATQDAAAVWGLPDFVYLPETHGVGSGTRELGDGIIIVGDLGIVVQVKSRDAPLGDAEKEARWLQKKASHGLSQGAGTIRRLQHAPVELTNLRGTTVEIDATDHRWLVVVVLDHPDPPDEVTPSVEGARHPAVVLLRRDWEFLFEQLKSTHAVAHYFQRVAGESLALGEEPVRYYDLAQADAEAPPEVFPPELATPAMQTFSAPLLPMAPAASEDREAHTLVRTLFEDIAITRLTSASEPDRVRILAELDRLPVAQRAHIGRFVLDAMDQVSNDQGEGVLWRMRSVRGAAGHAHLGFGACSRPYTEEIKEVFGLWVQLRHHDVVSVTKDVEGLTTVAVLLTPRTDGRRPWDTSVAAVSGDLSFSAAELEQLRTLWPMPAAA
jgi:hypothetical protein